MWIDIKKNMQKNEWLKNLYEELFALKEAFSKEEWAHLLQLLGSSIAETENIPHVVNSLYDEYSLQRALTEVEKTIKVTQDKLDFAKSNNNEDSIILLESELNYHKNNMKRHFRG